MTEDALALYRERLVSAATRLARKHARRRRRLAFAVTSVALLVVAGGTLAATGVVQSWLAAEPAPTEVKEDFAAIRPELGFTPEAGVSSKVAADGADFVLYATPTRQGGYCLAASAPWLQFDGDGRGYCVRPETARRPLVVGGIGASSGTHVIAGRATAPGAVAVSFPDPAGRPIHRRLGAGGFFVAAVDGSIDSCFMGRPWWPEFIVTDAEGLEVTRARFPLWIPGRNVGGEPMPACGSLGPMSDLEAGRVIKSEEG
jgi:hypothetical protein